MMVKYNTYNEPVADVATFKYNIVILDSSKQGDNTYYSVHMERRKDYDGWHKVRRGVHGRRTFFNFNSFTSAKQHYDKLCREEKFLDTLCTRVRDTLSKGPYVCTVTQQTDGIHLDTHTLKDFCFILSTEPEKAMIGDGSDYITTDIFDAYQTRDIMRDKLKA
jgi:hypothetical protein